MISPQVLERPGRWRGALAVTVLLLPLVPSLPLAAGALAREAGWPGQAFWGGLWTSGWLGLAVAFVSACVGLPLGVAAALYELPARRALLALAALPLLLPSLLPALGWSALAGRLGPGPAGALSTPAAGLLVFAGFGVSLVLLTSYAASLQLSASQVEAALLAGGERTSFVEAVRFSAPPALLAAGLSAVAALTDPAPGLVFGFRSAAAQILTTFSALFDFPGAARQSAVLAMAVLVVVLPLSLPVAARLAKPRAARAAAERRRRHVPRAGVLTTAALAVTSLLGWGLPLLGLALPLAASGVEIGQARETILRTGADTLAYGLGAGAVATGLGIALALAVGRSESLRRFSLGASLVLFALPAVLPALGIVRGATEAPPWADPLLRSRLTVAVALGLRTFPVAALLMLRAWGSLPPSWAGAAAVHGVPLGRYARAVLLPALLPTAALSTLLATLLATADVGTVLLLHPPGHASLPLAIFTVMANAPEAQVASLCLLYFLAAAGVLGLAWREAAGGAR